MHTRHAHTFLHTHTRHTRADQGGGKELLSVSYPVYSWLRSRLWREEVKDSCAVCKDESALRRQVRPLLLRNRAPVVAVRARVSCLWERKGKGGLTEK